MPKYFKPLIGDKKAKNQIALGILLDIAKKMGYEISNTPIIEPMALLTSKYVCSEELRSEIYHVKTNQDNMGLRYDLTFPLMIHRPGQVPKNYKRFEIGRVFRNGPTKKNRYKQFIQADYDILNPSKGGISEIFYIMKKIADATSEKYYLIYNNRKAIDQAFLSLNIAECEKIKYFSALDKLEKQNIDKITNNIVEFKSKFEKIIEILNNTACKWQNPKIEKIFQGKAIHNPHLARGQNWYVGDYWELRLEGSKSSLFAGGQYEYGGVRGIGFSIGYTQYLDLLKDTRKKWPILIFEHVESIKIYDYLTPAYEIVYVNHKNYMRQFLKWAPKSTRIFVYGKDGVAKSHVTMHFKKEKIKITLENLKAYDKFTQLKPLHTGTGL